MANIIPQINISNVKGIAPVHFDKKQDEKRTDS